MSQGESRVRDEARRVALRTGSELTDDCLWPWKGLCVPDGCGRRARLGVATAAVAFSGPALRLS